MVRQQQHISSMITERGSPFLLLPDDVSKFSFLLQVWAIDQGFMCNLWMPGRRRGRLE